MAQFGPNVGVPRRGNWRRVSRRAPSGYMAAYPVPYRPGRPPTSLSMTRPAPFTEEAPSRPIHGPVMRRAMSYLQSALSHEPDQASKRAAAELIIREFNATLNHYLTVLLPAYNERVHQYNLAVANYNTAVRMDRLNGNDV